MKITLNDRSIRSLNKKWWRETRKTLAAIRTPISDHAEHTDPERLKVMVHAMLKPERMNNHLLSLWGEVGGKFGGETEVKLKGSKNSNQTIELKADRREYWNERSKQVAARKAGLKAESILTTEEQAINRVIDDVILQVESEGMGIAEARKLLKESLSGDTMTTMESWQAERIARTEVVSAANTMSFTAAKENAEGVTKGWLSSQKVHARENHAEFEAMGDGMAMDHEYSPGLKFPGDPDCSDAGEVINCGCTIIYNVDNQIDNTDYSNFTG